MKNLSKLNWATFNLNQVFDFESPRLTKPKDLKASPNSKSACVSASILNNGLRGFFDCPANNKKGLITLNSSGDATAFYHPYKFVCTGNITLLKPAFGVDLYLGLFLCTCINHALRFENGTCVFTFSYAISRKKLNNVKLKLVAKQNGGPDTEQMRNYIEPIFKSIKYPKIQKMRTSELDLNSVEWGAFSVSEVFDLHSSTLRLKAENVKKNIVKKGGLRFVGGSSAKGNGTECLVSKKMEGAKVYKNFLGLITRGRVGYCFYHSDPCIVSNGVTVLTNPHLNSYNGIFLATAIQNAFIHESKESQGLKARLESKKILLPVGGRGKVNWDFMENYIKSIPNSELLDQKLIA